MKKIKNYFFYCSLKILHCKKLFNHLTVRSMQKINLSGIIAQQKLSEKDIAKQLFPTNKYPKLALSRVLRNEATLDADQISRLAALLNCTISELYSGEKWKSKVQKNLHIFTNGEYRAELDTETWQTKIFHNNSLFHESVIHTEAIALGTYLNELDLIIINHKEDGENTNND